MAMDLILVLFLATAGSCLAQEDGRSTADQRTATGSMVLIHGATFLMGIDAAQIPGVGKIFGINAPELFQDEVPKHRVTLRDFYIDQYLVTNVQFQRFTEANPEWQPNRMPRELDNGN